MKNGYIKFNKYNITPNVNCDILNEEDFNIFKLEDNIIYISKEPQDINGTNF